MKPHVLVVDDSLTVRMDLRGALSAAGFSVTTCETKQAAELALAERRFSLIVLDVILPDGTGLEILQLIRSSAELRSMPVVLLSMEVDVRDRIRGMSSGADEYVGKPYDIAYLIRRVRSLCDGAPESTNPGLIAGGRRILAVDDSPTYLAQLSTKLREDGHDVVLARSGREALDLLETQPVDCVVLDLLMPGIDGLETLRELRRLNGREATPTILLTASEDPAHQRAAISGGADEFVRKTVDLDVVRAKIRGLLRRKLQENGAAGKKGQSARGSDSHTNGASTNGAQTNGAAKHGSGTKGDTALFIRATAATGLSPMLARDVLTKALRRAGVDPHGMSAGDLGLAVPSIRDALGMFFTTDETACRVARIAALAEGQEAERT